MMVSTLAASAGIVTDMLASWALQNKPDLSMVLNGCLVGLVGITAGANVVGFSFSDHRRSSWRAGLFSKEHSLAVQAIGVLAAGVFRFMFSLVTWLVVSRVVALRVSEEEELTSSTAIG